MTRTGYGRQNTLEILRNQKITSSQSLEGSHFHQAFTSSQECHSVTVTAVDELDSKPMSL